jgi:hypothetical protein
MYQLSKDYERLFTYVCAGHIALGFVDYEFGKSGAPLRDAVKIQRRKPYEIYVGARGIQYGGLNGYEQEDGAEIAVFSDECKRMNLEWVAGLAATFPLFSPHQQLNASTATTISFDDVAAKILGRPNFSCGGIAKLLRQGSHLIETKAEAEQAYVIFWLLRLYEQYGADWDNQGDLILREYANKSDGGNQ